MFHHDSPYDACSPHSNQQSNRRAPIRAFDPSVDPVTNQMLTSHQRGDRTVEPVRDEYRGHRSQGTARAPFQHRTAADSEGSFGVEPQYDDANPNAEFFGVAAEPWQDFATPAHVHRRTFADESSSGRTSRSSTFADMETYLRGSSRPNPSGAAKEPTSSRATEVTFDEEPPPSAAVARKGTLRSGGGASRSKSLIGRLRRLRLDPDEADASEPVEDVARTRPQTKAQQRSQAMGLATPTGVGGLAPPIEHAGAAPLGRATPGGAAEPEPAPVRSTRTRNSMYARTSTPELADAATGVSSPARARTRRGYSTRAPTLPPKDEARAPPLHGAADYMETVPDADRERQPLGRSKTFLSRLASSGRARVI